MALHADLVGNEVLSAPGTGSTIQLGAAATGFRSFLRAEADGDVTDGQTLVPVSIESNYVDGIPTRRETATVTFNTGSPPTLTDRVTIRSSEAANAAIDAGADCVVYWDLIAGNVRFRDTFENITTDDATPKTIDVDRYRTNVTTDGSGLEQEIAFPSLTLADIGTEHAVVVTFTNAADTVRVTGVFVPDTANLFVEDGPARASWYWNGGAWVLQSGAINEDTPEDYVFHRHADGSITWTQFSAALAGVNSGSAYLFYASDSTGIADFIARDGNDHNTVEDLDLSISTSANPAIHRTRIISAGSGTTESFDLQSFFQRTGLRHLIVFAEQTAAGDTPSLDPSNVQFAGMTPSAINLNNVGDFIFLEINGGDPGFSGQFWNVLEVSDGVIVP